MGERKKSETGKSFLGERLKRRGNIVLSGALFIMRKPDLVSAADMKLNVRKEKREFEKHLTKDYHECSGEGGLSPNR